MKILLLSTSECNGGAAIATSRLMSALQKKGLKVTMLVRDKKTLNKSVYSINTSYIQRKLNFIRFIWERLILFWANRFDRKKLFQVSIANTGADISEHPLVKDTEIIHLNWINQGFLSVKDIQKLVNLNKPILWTMHDMWPCTGICHYSYDCTRYMENCGECAFLNSRKPQDLSYKIFQEKEFLAESSVHIVTVSSWLKKIAETSALTKKLSVTVIPNVIDTSLFHPSDKLKAREELGLLQTNRIVLMGAACINDPIKGLDYLKQALALLENKKDILLLLFGGIKGDNSFLNDFPVPIVSMGLLSDTSKIAKLYAAADVTVVPSLYETFGQTLIESMACGCPVVSFNNSGQTDIIDHKKNGYLARYKDSVDLSHGIEWIFENSGVLNMSKACLEKVQNNYTESIVAEKYLQLYKSLLK